MNKILQKIKSDFISFNITSLTRGRNIGIACSGGADSMALLYILSQLKDILGFNIYALHYDHKWRKESVLDSRLVRKFCAEKKLGFIYDEDKSKNIIKDEETARNKRYLFFEKAARKYSLKVVCTAHHKDDQVETVLFRLARGTGPFGLQPIKKNLVLKEKMLFYRPLLDMTKTEIYTYAKKNNIPFVEDETNKNIKYKRNLIRREIIPLLRKINPKAPDNILLCSEMAFLQSKVLDKHFCDLEKKLRVSKFKYDLKKFFNLDEYTQKSFFYWFMTFKKFKGSLVKTNQLLDVLNKRTKIDLNKDYFFVADKDYFYFERKKRKKEIPIKNTEVVLRVNGVNIKKISVNDSIFSLERFNERMRGSNFPKDIERIAYVDMALFKDKKLTFRLRKPKDVIQPLGCSKPVKLKKYMVNKKIPQNFRYKIPLLCFNNEILWLPGYSISEKIKVFKNPTHILKLYEEE